jgi:murein DD-endopeptidase MepM/ murein hydrolase activator NlpD
MTVFGDGGGALDSISLVILLLIGMVAFTNVRNGTFGQWLKAKFFGAGPKPAKSDQVAGFPSDAIPIKPAAYTGLGAGAGGLANPVAGKTTVTGTFGEQRPGHTHAGIDLAAPTGTVVDAARGGTVVFAGPSGGYGNLVTVDHGGGFRTLYAHLSNIGVKLGQVVNVGDQLGAVGATGDATGPHLHFEVRQNGVPQDPGPLLGYGNYALTGTSA